jgi:uncharacterized protein (DUF3820 family)
VEIDPKYKRTYEDKPFPFGAHRDVLICDVPKSYLNWILEQEWFEEKFKDLYDLVKLEIAYRDKWHIKE